MLRSVLEKLAEPRVLREQLANELGFVAVQFPVNALGSSLVPRVVRFAGYRLWGMRTQTPNIFPGLVLAGDPRRIRLGEGTFLNRGCLFESVGDITLGRGVQVGPQAAFLTSHHPRTAEGRVATHVEPRPVVVGDGAWIGARAVVLPGVTIAHDCVVAAGSVVTKDCDVPGATYAGVPARLVREPSAEYLAATGGSR